MVEQQERPRKRTAGRSPSYPGIGLEEAIQKARIIYQREGRAAAPISTITGHWGYRSESGNAGVAVAALKKFGLLVDEGSRQARRGRLSQEALRILLDEREDSSERQQLLQEAALKPTIHQELWEKYDGHLPSDSTLRHDLLFGYGFTENAVREFIRQFRDTLAFTGLTGSDTLGEQTESKPKSGDREVMPPAPTAPPVPPQDPPTRAGREIQIPISLDEWATLRAPFPLNEAKWNQMIAVLEAMKPALVAPQSQPDQPPAPAQPLAPPSPPASAQNGAASSRVTAEALELLGKVKDGGVPAFMTGNLKRIAEENGVRVDPDATPNQIIEELQRKSQGLG